MARDTEFVESVRMAMSVFGAEVGPKLRGNGWQEDQLRGPLENLVRAVSRSLGLSVTLIGEVPLVDLEARPDYAVEVAGALVGHIELKRPKTGADTELFTGRNARQWKKLALLPNVLVSDGEEYALYRNGRRVGGIAQTRGGGLKRAGHKLEPADSGVARVFHDFLTWYPQPPRAVGQLVHAVAKLCQLLCEEVRHALELERAGRRTEVFTVLAEDWRRLLFPGKDDSEFADQYAQTVVFALLLARVESIVFDGDTMHGIATKLGKKHSLMGKALDVLTDDSLIGLSTTLDTLLRVIAPVDWALLDDGSGDAYLRLYEDFLQVYDRRLREQTGSYYTPNGVVNAMSRLTEDIVRERFGADAGFASPEVVVIDPAMGTGTFLLTVLERAAAAIAAEEGEGAVGPRLREMVGNRLIGFEMQTGPYAVAELRMHAMLKKHGSAAPADGLRLCVTDTLDSPKDDFGWLPISYQPLAESRRRANYIKRNERVMVVIGNPPHDAVGRGAGKWVENGDPKLGERPPLDAFRREGNGRYESKLSNLYVHFWRWATWKVFDAHADAPFGVVAFLTPKAWLKGRAFEGMRHYLRNAADEGWVIDISPEGQYSDVATRLFPDVAQELCIALFVRWRDPGEAPAVVRHLAVAGRREAKLARLRDLRIDDPQWQLCETEPTAPFMAPGSAMWTVSPKLSDLFPWSSRGVTPGRVWAYAPDRATLEERWKLFIAAGTEERRRMFGEARDRDLDTECSPLPGIRDHGRVPLRDESGPMITPERVGYRSFDRQWIIPDNRLCVVGRPDLWRVRGDRQIYTVEQNAHPVVSGPALVFSSLVPDMDYFNNRSGCARPLYRDAAGTAPNLAPGLLRLLEYRLDLISTPEDVLAYCAAVVSHPAFTERFREDLAGLGLRVPFTADPKLWRQAVRIGRRVLWLHSYGDRCVDPAEGRPRAVPRLPPERRPRCAEQIPDTPEGMPEAMRYDAESGDLWIGTGRIHPVSPDVRGYEVSRMNVIDKWFGYRRRIPAGKRRLPLDHFVADRWTPDWTSELLSLLNVLGLLVDEQPAQRALLDAVCSGPLLTVDDLFQAGVLPVPPAMKRPPKQAGPAGTLFET